LRRPVTLIVITSAVYQGLSPVLLTFPSIGVWDNYRNGVQQSYISSAVLLMSAGMLAFTITYLMTFPERAEVVLEPADIRSATKALDWRWLTGACVPLAAFTYEGRGYNGAAGLAGSATSVGTDLAEGLFVVLVVVAAFSFLLKHGVRWFIPVLMVQSLVLAAAGERTPIITDGITLVLMLLLADSRPSARQLRRASALTLIAFLAITGLRVEQGRSLFHNDSGLSARISALGSGLTAQTVLRMDGVDFAGAILQSVSSGQPRLSATDVLRSLLLIVPSSVWSSKLAHDNALNPTQMEMNDFGLQQVNFLPTLPGLYVGFFSPPSLIAFLAFIGLLCGWGERWLFRRCTAARLLLFAGTVTAALTYEQGLPGMLLQLRAAAAIAVVVKLIDVIRVRNTRRQSAEILVPYQATFDDTA